MKALGVCRKPATDGCPLVRARKGQDAAIEPIDIEYDVKHFADGGNKRGWFYLDAFSGSGVVAVVDKLSDENRRKLLNRAPLGIVSLAFRLINRTQGARS